MLIHKSGATFDNGIWKKVPSNIFSLTTDNWGCLKFQNAAFFLNPRQQHALVRQPPVFCAKAKKSFPILPPSIVSFFSFWQVMAHSSVMPQGNRISPPRTPLLQHSCFPSLPSRAVTVARDTFLSMTKNSPPVPHKVLSILFNCFPLEKNLSFLQSIDYMVVKLIFCKFLGAHEQVTSL